jgi:hypothetical protein
MKLRPFIAETMWEIEHDPWGSCLGALGPILDVLYVRHGEIPATAGYRPAMALHDERHLVYDEVSGENDLAAYLLEKARRWRDRHRRPGARSPGARPLCGPGPRDRAGLLKSLIP